MSTLEVPGLGRPYGLLVLADGTRLVSSLPDRRLSPAGWLTNIAGGNGNDDDDDDDDDDATLVDEQGPAARFNAPAGMTVDAAGHIVVADSGNNALRRVFKAGAVSTLAGNVELGFADGQGDTARFNLPCGVALADNDEIVVADTYTPSGSSRTAAPCACSPATGRKALKTGRARPRASTAQRAWRGTRTGAFW